MDITNWIRSQAATGQPLNIHAVQRERPDLLEQAFAGPTPRGWRRSLRDAGVDPYKIVLDYEDQVECAVCGMAFVILVRHLKIRHGMTCEEYLQEFGRDHETTSESYRAGLTGLRPISGIAHWERVWSPQYVIDWILRLHHEECIPVNHEHIHQVLSQLQAKRAFVPSGGARSKKARGKRQQPRQPKSSGCWRNIKFRCPLHRRPRCREVSPTNPILSARSQI